MPKVNDEYIQQKRSAIIGAARAVCESKPLYELNMTDIIRKASISKGGIYLYYKDIDEVTAAYIDNVRRRVRLYEHIPAAAPLKETLAALGRYLDECPIELLKVRYELDVLWTVKPERAKVIRKYLDECDDESAYTESRLMTRLIALLPEQSAGHTKDELKQMLIPSVSGIITKTTLFRVYGIGQVDGKSVYNGRDGMNSESIMSALADFIR